MDYSLLLFIVESDFSNEFMIKDIKTGYYYNLAIIDYLSTYNYFKKAEHAAKKLRYGTKIIMCSVVNPNLYATRFLNFIFNLLGSFQ